MGDGEEFEEQIKTITVLTDEERRARVRPGPVPGLCGLIPMLGQGCRFIIQLINHGGQLRYEN